jgi:hypothetical protein
MIKNGRKPANPQITLSWLPSQKARAIKKTPKIRSLKKNCNKRTLRFTLHFINRIKC